jgi:hypothetical protein
MFRKHLTTALSALLAVAACAPCARAQSGRRFPQAAGDKGFVVLTSEKSDAAEETESVPAEEVREQRDQNVDLRGLNARRSAPVVYAQNGNGGTSTKAKIEVGALFACLILGIILTGHSYGYAPPVGTAPYAGLRR